MMMLRAADADAMPPTTRSACAFDFAPLPCFYLTDFIFLLRLFR